jgi:hypothetical protein
MPLHEKRVAVCGRDIDDADPLVTFPGSGAGTPTHTPDKQPVLRGYGGVLATLSALLVVGGAVVALSSQGRHQLALSFLRQPEKYTELYFSGDGPTQAGASPDWVVVNVPFTVVNHEGRTSQYPYAVQVIDDAQAPVGRVEGSADITDGNSLSATVAVGIPASEPWSAVDVYLAGRSQHIRFLRAG